ncbi:MAG: 50S ribosomal protein L30 [Rickettsiales bacterium]|nr:50S ribosomal protein L30 [Rickettsiales bacterium]
MAKVKITQIRSAIGKPKRQKLVITSLGLGKINRSREIELNPQIEGMISKVSHLVKVEEI